MSRLHRQVGRGEGLTDSLLDEILYTDPDEYRLRYGVRKTWVEVAGVKIDLESFFKENEGRASVTYRTFWQRLKKHRTKGSVDPEVLEQALTFDESDWISFYGGGRHRTFTYTGELYPEHYGRKFHSVTALLKSLGRYEDRPTVWSRLKAGWDLDDALSIPVAFVTERTGLIYQIIRVSTGQIYVGLTHSTAEQRFAFHASAARRESTTALGRAIREDGADGFVVEVLEAGIEDPELLKIREQYWAQKQGAHGPKGLNTAKTGALGSSRGVPVEWNGESFQSTAEASRQIGKRTGLAPHVVESRLRDGRPLPLKARTHSSHPDSGTNLFRRWLALKRRHDHQFDPLWRDDYDRFKADVGPTFLQDDDQKLLRVDPSKPWGPDNWRWGTTKEKVEAAHGKPLTIHGVEYPSISDVARAFGIGYSTLKYRLNKKKLTPEEAVAEPIGPTSYKNRGEVMVDGHRFRSENQAILYISDKYGLTEGQAKYRFQKGDFGENLEPRQLRFNLDGKTGEPPT